MPPFVKWLGGKGQLAASLARHVPDTFDRYIEPMVGGGALFWHLAETGRLKGREVVLADANEWLMRTYKAVRDDVGDLVAELRGLQEDYARRPELLFHGVRKRWNDGARSPAAFIFLKQTSFNGLWRVNLDGHLNMPWGKYTAPNICNTVRLRACHDLLQGVTLQYGDWSRTLREARPRAGDVVYCDPPYFGTFNAYTTDAFGEEEHTALLARCAGLSSRGVAILYTHVDTPQAQEWLDRCWPNASVQKVQNRRSISCKATGRHKVCDLVVHNTPSAVAS